MLCFRAFIFEPMLEIHFFSYIGIRIRQLMDILVSRFYLSSFIDLTGFTKSRSFILHGPLCTGKTMIAKRSADILNVNAKIVSRPQPFNWPLDESGAIVLLSFEKDRFRSRKMQFTELNSSPRIR